MVKILFRLLLIIVAGVLIYNFFLGTDAEKENAKDVVEEFKDVGRAVKDLLTKEKEKLDNGKYDDALNQVGNLFNNIKNAVKPEDTKSLDELANLEDRRKGIEQELEDIENKPTADSVEQEEKKRKLNIDLKKLIEDTERFLNKVNFKQEETQ